MAAGAMATYPYHNQQFYIYIDASDYQLVAAIMLNVIPAAYLTKKIIGAQMNYTTMEKEPLSIVETLK